MNRFLFLCLLLHSISAGAQTPPEITVYDKTLFSLKGFRSLVVDTYLEEKAVECGVREKALLTKALLILGKSSIDLIDHGPSSDGVIMFSVATEESSDELCLSIVRVRMYSPAIATFERAKITQPALVPLFEQDKIVYSGRATHHLAVEEAIDPILDSFLLKWSYFNDAEGQ